MKLKYIFLLLFVVSISYCYSLPEMEMLTPNPNYLESVVIKLSSGTGFENSITLENIHVYEGRREITTYSKIYNYDGIYYIYLLFTKPGTYDIVTDALLYKSGDAVVSHVINKTINLSNDTTNSLLIEPGVIYSKNPQITLTNRGEKELSINYESEKFKISPGAYKKINISVSESFKIITIDSYKKFRIPVILIEPLNISNETQEKNTHKTTNLRPSEESISLNAYEGDNKFQVFTFLNFGNNTLYNVNITNDIPFVRFETITKIVNPKDIINLTINFVHNKEGNYVGSTNVTYTEEGINYNYSIPIYVRIYPMSAKNDETSSYFPNKTCKELNGSLCTKGTCSGEGNSYEASDGYCCGEGSVCIDNDILNNEKKSLAWIWGVLILIIISAAIYFFYDKYKKIGIKKNKK